MIPIKHLFYEQSDTKVISLLLKLDGIKKSFLYAMAESITEIG